MSVKDFTYILITPAKNEENNLPKLIPSIIKQMVTPVAWFIVDDGSDDETYQIIRKATSDYLWIHSLRLETRGTYDIEEHYASVCRKGFKYALKYCDENNIEFDYIALSDADMVYPKNYFYQLLLFLSNNSDFGIASGKILIMDKSGGIHTEGKTHYNDQPRGTGRVWRKETFEQTNGYMLTKSPDTVSNIMALLKGWKIKQLAPVECYQLRDTGGKIDLWDGYFSMGKRAYYLNANFLSLFNVVVDINLISRQRKSLIKSIAYISGYFQSFIRREGKIENVAIKRYMGSYKRVIREYLLFMKKVIAK
ncbi:Glycosyltransferase involved in cell wall bisynthesis [Candidatus Methanophagaceae archaeon]|nr:Glycosyltransferase involved in cell wall bisynthesis [Methanophagales archaeon]